MNVFKLYLRMLLIKHSLNSYVWYYFINYYICEISLQVTIICILNWRNLWKDANLLMMKMLSVWQMAGWKSNINDSSKMKSELWKNAGASAFQLQKTMLNSNKIRCMYLVINYVILQIFFYFPSNYNDDITLR